MIVANLTPDNIQWMHIGVDGTIKAGEIKEFDEARGNFLLTKFGARGLLRLEYGDQPETKQKVAHRIWSEFWTRQITVFNQDNERRKNTNREYVYPTEELEAHAEKLGLNLVGPWTVRQTDNAEIAALKQKNTELEAQNVAILQRLDALTAALGVQNVPEALRTTAEKVELSRGEESQAPEDNTEEPIDHKKLVVEFQMLNKDKFGEWVMRNLDRLQSPDYPAAVRSMVEEKWARLIQGDFPLPK